MSGKIYNLSEKAMTEKYEDYVFTKVMALYAEEESARILSEIDTENRADPKEIEKIYSKIERRENLSTLWKYSRKLLQFAAMVVFVAVISLSSTVVAFAEVREAVAEAIYHLIIKDYGRYTQITIGESTAFIDPEIYTWEDAYAPTYMPEGFELGNFSCTSSQQSVDYYCGEDYIAIIQGRNSTGQIDTENAEIVENLIIGDSNALFVVKDDTTYVSWIMGDNMFLVIGSAAPEEILKVAKSIKPLGHFKTEEPEEEYEFVDPGIYDWEGAYGLTYVPEGFNLSGVYRYTGNRIIDYKKENEYFSFLQAYEATADVDTEGAQKIDKILIGDSEGLLVVKNGLTTVSWYIKNTYMTILGTAPTDEIIKMAQGIKPIGKSEPAEEYEFVDPEIYDWEGAYGLTFVPNAYYFKEKKSAGTKNMIIYESDNGHFTFSQSTGTPIARVDTENAENVETIVINESEALIVEKDGFVIIAWNNQNIFFSLRGTLPADIMVLMAQSIKPIGKTEPAEGYEFVDPEIYTWNNAYGMTYLTKGFELYDVQNGASQKIINYIDEEKTITFSQAFNVTSHVDTEDADIIKDIQIGESKGLLVVKDDWSCVAWNNGDVLLKVRGTAPTEEIIKIAEGVKPIN